MTEREALRQMFDASPALARQLRELVVAGKIKVGFPDSELGDVVVCIGRTTNIDGSQQVRCGCGALGWITPSTQRMVARRGVRFICMDCFPKLITTGGRPQ
jgi:hypothetical protein